MGEMIELAARAIDEASDEHSIAFMPPSGGTIDDLVEACRAADLAKRIRQARAAIGSMRHIPDEYFSVLVRSFNMRDDAEHRTVARLWYHRMLDEALREEGRRDAAAQ
jgi:hypothetical protein